MKGRRRARRLALQALYELDQSTHRLEDVIRGRLTELYGSSITSALRTEDRPIAWWLVDRDGRSGFNSVDLAEAAAEFEVDEAKIEAVLNHLHGLKDQADYGVRIVRGVRRNLDEIDAVIAEIAPEWPVPQMAPIDRNLLRIALWEIASRSSPVRVAINEAVELARQFSGEGARRMVNGALGAYVSRSEELALSLRGER